MNTRRKLVIALGAGALAPLASFAQQSGKIWRVGFLGSESSSYLADRMEALRSGLRNLGYIEGGNLILEVRRAEGRYERLPALAAELVALKVEVILASGIKAVYAARRTTNTVPIVGIGMGDPVALGFAASLARPGGNITGLTSFNFELMVKRVALLKEAAPRIARIAVLQNPADPGSRLLFDSMVAHVKPLKLTLQAMPLRDAGEFENAFASMAKNRVDAIVVQPDTLFNVNAGKIVDLAIKSRYASAGTIGFAVAGGLIGYSAGNLVELHRAAAVFVDKILKGTKPGDIPIEQPTTFEMGVNLKTAKALGIKVPQSILIQATRVIE